MVFTPYQLVRDACPDSVDVVYFDAVELDKLIVSLYPL